MIKTLSMIAIASTSLIPMLSYSGSWSEPLQVNRIMSPPSGDSLFQMGASVGHPDCPTADHIQLTSSLQSIKELHANMLLAKVMDLNVTVLSGSGSCSTSEIVTNPTISFN